MTREEHLAIELHKIFRAALAANLGKSRLHDHGWSLCGSKGKNYFRKKAALLISRADGKKLNDTLMEIENQLRAKLLLLGVQE